ncbi:MAG TPA: tetratricopeptide repeat protein [Pirellulales bacterium]|nr:tetratricopeptide repeat protein [Pirellulales bacterium]
MARSRFNTATPVTRSSPLPDRVTDVLKRSRYPFAGAAIIVIATCAAYLPAINGGFVLDDDALVTRNSSVKASDGLYRIWFTSEPLDYWPITNTVFWLEWRLWGMNPIGYHITNLVLHIINSLLIWVVLRTLEIPQAFLAAAIFALHPVNVESTAWIAQLKNLLALFFFLLSILFYLKAGFTRTSFNSTKVYSTILSPFDWLEGKKSYWISLAVFVFAMLSKTSVVVLPLILLLVVWWQLGRVTWKDFLRTVPFFLVCIALTVVTLWFQKEHTGNILRDVTLLDRLLGAGATIWFYLYKAFLPFDLSFVYPQWHIDSHDFVWWLPLIATIIITLILIWKRQTSRGRPTLFAWVFFCVALLPVMGFSDVGFMQHSLVADRYQYVAIIAVASIVSAYGSYFFQRLRWPLFMPAAAIMLLTLFLLTFQQASLYHDAVNLYTATLIKNPESPLIHYNLGVAYKDTGEPVRAREQFEQAVKLFPSYVDAIYGLGILCAENADFQGAINYYKRALELDSNNAEVHNNLGFALNQLGNPQEAFEHFKKAVELKPDLAKARNNLGIVLAQKGQIQEAITEFESAIRVDPNLAEAYASLGNVDLLLRKFAEAIDQYKQALKREPRQYQVYGNMALAYAQLKRPADAIAAAQKAIQFAQEQHQTQFANQAEAWLKDFQYRQSLSP